MSFPSRVAAWAVLVNQWVIGLCMAAMALMVIANVVSRYGFNASIAWTEELSRFLMIAVTYLGAGLALREGRLIAVDAFQAIFPRATKLIRCAVGVVIIVFMLTLAWVGYEYAMFAVEQETPVLGISAAIPYMIIPVGALVLVLHLSLFFSDFVNRKWAGIHDDDTDDSMSGEAHS